MPQDIHGNPVLDKKGALHFHCNLGSCMDDMIRDEINSFVPKHKSYLKESDLAFVGKKT